MVSRRELDRPARQNRRNPCNQERDIYAYWFVVPTRCPLLARSCCLFTAAAHGGNSGPKSPTTPAAVNLMLLLSDGTSCSAKNNGSTIGNGWVRLTPNAAGSYIGGVDHARIDGGYPPLLLGSGPQGRTDVSLSPAASTAPAPPSPRFTTRSPTPGPQAPVPTTLMDPRPQLAGDGFPQCFYDSNSEILPNGNVVVTPVCPKTSRQSLIYNLTTNTLGSGSQYFPRQLSGRGQLGQTPDDTILTIDPFGTFQRAIQPGLGTHGSTTASSPVSLYDSIAFEPGGAVLPQRQGLFPRLYRSPPRFYTPTGTTSPGTLDRGPGYSEGKGTPDAPCAMMVNGKVLCVSPIPTAANNFPSPTTFYEFD